MTQVGSKKPASHLDVFQRHPQRHPSYQASSEGWLLSSGATPAPFEVLNFHMYTDGFLEHGKTIIISSTGQTEGA